MISKVVVEGFRGIPQRLSFDMAPVTLLSGRNGFGKTTLFDAIDWCLFGSAWRLGDDAKNVRNLYYPETEPFVAVTLRLNGSPVTVERRESGVAVDGFSISDRDLALEFLRDQDSIPPYARDLGLRLRRLAYLPQSDMRKLVEAGSQAERRALIQSLLGVLHAVVVESSMRRIRERIQEKRQRLEARLREIQHDREIGGPEVADNLRRSEDATVDLEYIRSVLGAAAQGITSLEALSELGERALRRLRDRKAELVEFRRFVESERTALEEYRRERDATDADIVQQRSRLEALRNDVKRLSAIAEKFASERAELELRLEEARQTADHIGQTLNGIASKASTSERSRQSREAHELAQEKLAAVRLRAEEKRNTVNAARAEVERSRQRLIELIAREDTARRADTTSRQLQAVGVEVDESERRVVAAAEAEDSLRRSMESARQRLAELSTRYEAARARASRRQRVVSILAEVPSLLADLNVTACPLCGYDYGDTSTLIAHLDEAGTRVEAESDELASLRSTVETQQRAVHETEEKLAKAARQHSEARQKRETVQGQRASLLESQSRLSEAPNIEVAIRERSAAETLVRDAEEGRRSLELDWRASESDLATAEAEARLLRNEANIQHARLAAIEKEMSADARTQSELEADLRSAEVRKHELTELIRRNLADYEDLLKKRQTAQRDTAPAEQRFRDADALLAGLSERIRGAEARVREKIIAVFGEEADDDRVQQADLELRAAGETEVRLQRALTELTRLRTNREAEEYRNRIESLDAAEQEVRSQLEDLERAGSRFKEVSQAVSARARDEGNSAGQRIREGIQECLRELYPHRHLDEVDLDTEAGDVLLTDRFLSHSVQPEPYSSTGQLNVLALALFIATALRQRMSKLSFLLLDEPIQNLDDVHFLAFIALAKRIVLSRQMILSTADKNVAEIFKRQMLGVNGGLRYRQYEWQGFDPKKGPDVSAVGTTVR